MNRTTDFESTNWCESTNCDQRTAMNEVQVQNGRVEAEETGGEGGSPSARYSLGFWSLVATQFQGAFNDNALKFLVIYLVVDMSRARAKAELAGAGRRGAFRAALYSVFHDRRIPGGPLQQALGDHRHEMDGSWA